MPASPFQLAFQNKLEKLFLTFHGQKGAGQPLTPVRRSDGPQAVGNTE